MKYKRKNNNCVIKNGWGYEKGIMKDEGGDFKYFMLFAKYKLVLMLCLSDDYWYDGTPNKKLRFTYKKGTIYLRRLAINIK